MKYRNASNVLPEELIRQIQQYIDGELIYIPRLEGKQKGWGENSGARSALYERDRRIFEEYGAGKKVSEIAAEYFLSEQSIRRIVASLRKSCPVKGSPLENGL